MKEIKLWEINQRSIEKQKVTPLKSVNQTKTEKALEKILVENPELFFDGMKIVGRQTETAGGQLDLLGVDADGRLVVFELKRGALTRDAVSQTRSTVKKTVGGFLFASAAVRIDLKIEKNIVSTAGQNSLCEIDDINYEDQSKILQLNETRLAYRLAQSGLDEFQPDKRIKGRQ